MSGNDKQQPEVTKKLNGRTVDQNPVKICQKINLNKKKHTNEPCISPCFLQSPSVHPQIVAGL